MLGGFPPLSAAANALSTPPGEYGRKTETQKELTGGPQSGGACGVNSKQREEPYQVLTSSDNPRERLPFGGRVTGGHGCRQLVSEMLG